MERGRVLVPQAGEHTREDGHGAGHKRQRVQFPRAAHEPASGRGARQNSPTQGTREHTPARKDTASRDSDLRPIKMSVFFPESAARVNNSRSAALNGDLGKTSETLVRAGRGG